MLDGGRFSVNVFRALPDDARRQRLKELELILNEDLRGCDPLDAFQERLYALIDQLCALGHALGRWDYDSEIEYWGGGSYMDPTIPDELLLKSHYPHGVKLNWGEFAFDDWDEP